MFEKFIYCRKLVIAYLLNTVYLSNPELNRIKMDFGLT